MPHPAESAVRAALATVDDPEIRRPITDLDMVESVEIGADGAVRVGVLLTAAPNVNDFLKDLEHVKVVRCDEVQLRILGLSLAN